jgi:phosphopantothenoylcysteine decarboxylase/phosphopantothenate--cysteine ligase
MFKACLLVFKNSDIAVLSAAVADYKPKHVADSKIKKKDAEFSIELTKTTDILETLGKQKKINYWLVLLLKQIM